jgi:protoporphyrinogen oxidase
MVPDPSKSSLGMEYFCNEGDELWNRPDSALIELSRQEIDMIGLANYQDIEDACVFRVPKSYPVYDSDYREALNMLQTYVNNLENFQTIGRNGLHRYNNQDHAMLTGMLAVRNMMLEEQNNLWQVNAEQEYNEETRQDSRMKFLKRT